MKNTQKLIEGFPGISQRVKWAYRGYIIVQRFRSHDGRNKTHNGFDWEVLDPKGDTVYRTHLRKRAREYIDAQFTPTLHLH